MRAMRWVYGTTATVLLMAGALTVSAPACTSSSNGTRKTIDAGNTSLDTGPPPMIDSGFVDAGIPYDADFIFTPGTGAKCTNVTGEPPSSTCDPSDETATSCGNGKGTLNGCTYDSVCGNTSTCEPWTSNPLPSKGVDVFRMRDINITAPSAIAAVQGLVVATAVAIPDSPDGGAHCGEKGTGLFNWMMAVDQKNKTLKTGGSPPSSDPFGVGYCFIDGNIVSNGVKTAVAPVTMTANFTGNVFSTNVYADVLNIPIFLAPAGVVILPIRGGAFHDVSVSTDGNCIGGINMGSNTSTGGCLPPSSLQQEGTDSCSHWHTAGALGGYITLKDADSVLVQVLNESLCVLITGESVTNDGGYKTCSAAGLAAGDYCAPSGSTAGHACTNGDSSWLAAQFAASAVKLATGTGVDEYQGADLCNKGTLDGG